jgi:hypothetical protein
MSDTLQTHAPSRGSRAAWVVYAIGVAVCIAALVLALRLQRGPATVKSLTVHNDTPFEVTIDASGGPNEAVTPLGVVAGNTAETFQTVIDEGQSWQFSLTCSGDDGGSITRTRTDLARSGWQLHLGTDVATACGANLPSGH